MVTANYLLMLGVATVFTLLLALASHAVHAYLAMPDRWQREIPGRYGDQPYPNAEYDDQGFWEFASLRNYLYHASGGLLFLLGMGLWYWDRQHLALAQVCGYVSRVGITPVFCM